MNCWWMSFVCLLFSPPRLSLVSGVFDFNDSLNDVAPVSPILLPNDEKRKGRVNCRWMPFVSSFFCLYHPYRV